MSRTRTPDSAFPFGDVELAFSRSRRWGISAMSQSPLVASAPGRIGPRSRRFPAVPLTAKLHTVCVRQECVPRNNSLSRFSRTFDGSRPSARPHRRVLTDRRHSSRIGVLQTSSMGLEYVGQSTALFGICVIYRGSRAVATHFRARVPRSPGNSQVKSLVASRIVCSIPSAVIRGHPSVTHSSDRRSPMHVVCNIHQCERRGHRQPVRPSRRNIRAASGIVGPMRRTPVRSPATKGVQPA